MWCAVRSEKPKRDCSARTASAKTPPPGTITAGWWAALSAARQRGRPPELARLPPSLRTIMASLPRGSVALAARATTDYRDAHRLRLAIGVEFVDRDADAHRAGIVQAVRSDALGERLDQLDMTLGDNRFDAADNRLVVEHLSEVLAGKRARIDHVELDVDAYALPALPLMLVNADAAGELKVAYSYAIARTARLLEQAAHSERL